MTEPAPEWRPRLHALFGDGLNALFGGFAMGLRRLEEARRAPPMDPAVLEETLGTARFVPAALAEEPRGHDSYRIETDLAFADNGTTVTVENFVSRVVVIAASPASNVLITIDTYPVDYSINLRRASFGFHNGVCGIEWGLPLAEDRSRVQVLLAWRPSPDQICPRVSVDGVGRGLQDPVARMFRCQRYDDDPNMYYNFMSDARTAEAFRAGGATMRPFVRMGRCGDVRIAAFA